MFSLFNLNLIFDSFENTSLLHYYVLISDIFVLVITSGIIYMFIHFFILFIFNTTFVISSHIVNVTISLSKSVMSTLYDIVLNYLFYKGNVFFVLISYIYIYIFLNNIIGLIPFSNTINNHLNVTGLVAFIC